VKVGDFNLMPPLDPTLCPACKRKHEPDQPHDGSALHFMYWWKAKHDRWGTWKDAMSHCTPEVQRAWETALRERGAWTEPE